MPRRYRLIRTRPPRLTFCVLVNGLISTMPLTSSGSMAAAMVAAPPEMECPTMTAGPPRWRISASRSPATSVRVMASLPVTDFQPMLDSPCPRRSALATR